jgi:hypothetical protein
MSERAPVSEQFSEDEHGPASPDLQDALDAIVVDVEPGGRLTVTGNAPSIAEIPIGKKQPEAYMAGRLALVKDTIAERCHEQGIDIAHVPRNQRRRLSLIIGSVLVDNTESGIIKFQEEHKDDDPKTPCPIRHVPNFLLDDIDKFYRDAGSKIHSPDNTERRTALRHQQPLVEIALTHINHFPDVHLAADLEEEWYNRGLVEASECVTAVLAAYGRRLAVMDQVWEQQHDTQPAPDALRQQATAELLRIIRAQDLL